LVKYSLKIVDYYTERKGTAACKILESVHCSFNANWQFKHAEETDNCNGMKIVSKQCMTVYEKTIAPLLKGANPT
jgi:hypothetical protein